MKNKENKKTGSMESSSLKKAIECCEKQKHEVKVKVVRTGRGKHKVDGGKMVRGGKLKVGQRKGKGKEAGSSKVGRDIQREEVRIRGREGN